MKAPSYAWEEAAFEIAAVLIKDEHPCVVCPSALRSGCSLYPRCKNAAEFAYSVYEWRMNSDE